MATKKIGTVRVSAALQRRVIELKKEAAFRPIGTYRGGEDERVLRRFKLKYLSG
jgi:hypothetical protein